MKAPQHAYRGLTPEARKELNANYLIDSWSYSKISEFSRNEKSFEMTQIYGQYSKSSASTVAGNAYHRALDMYFSFKKDGQPLDLAGMQMFAYEYIENVRPNFWKRQKTTPTVESCIQKCTTIVNQLLSNFMKEKHTYEDNILEVLDVEVCGDEYVTINGVDIPLPVHFRIDLVVKTKDGKIAVVDHKSKYAFTDEEELKLSIGRQAITYVIGYETKTALQVNEVWFVENKYSQNKNGAPQLNKFIVSLDENTRKLYEALIYEPLRRMIAAVSDPDYVYLINDSDNFVDRAEIYDFWAKTMVAEVEEFNVLPGKKELVAKRLRKIRDAALVSVNPKIIKEFRANAAEFIQYDLSNKAMTQQEKIEHTFRSFGIKTKVAHSFDGYSSNTYLLELQAGVKVSSIHQHKMDIANALDVSSVRIPKDLTVYSGKSYVAIETAKQREKILFYDEAEIQEQKIPIGIDNFGRKIIWDLNNHSTPYALICGAAGSGKSVELDCIINYAKASGVENIVILDPKFEFEKYKNIAQVYNHIEEIEEKMSDLVTVMNKRVKNGSGKEGKILIVFDEFADAVTASKKGKDLYEYEMIHDGFYANGNPKYKREKTGERKSLEENLRILLQKGRSLGFRIVAATQRASVKVITGDAKVNFSVQICFRVPKELDSKVVLDEGGAESLAGMGDGLMRSPEYPEVVRFQAYYKPN